MKKKEQNIPSFVIGIVIMVIFSAPYLLPIAIIGAIIYLAIKSPAAKSTSQSTPRKELLDESLSEQQDIPEEAEFAPYNTQMQEIAFVPLNSDTLSSLTPQPTPLRPAPSAQPALAAEPQKPRIYTKRPFVQTRPEPPERPAPMQPQPQNPLAGAESIFHKGTLPQNPFGSNQKDPLFGKQAAAGNFDFDHRKKIFPGQSIFDEGPREPIFSQKKKHFDTNYQGIFDQKIENPMLEQANKNH